MRKNFFYKIFRYFASPLYYKYDFCYDNDYKYGNCFMYNEYPYYGRYCFCYEMIDKVVISNSEKMLEREVLREQRVAEREIQGEITGTNKIILDSNIKSLKTKTRSLQLENKGVELKKRKSILKEETIKTTVLKKTSSKKITKNKNLLKIESQTKGTAKIDMGTTRTERVAKKEKLNTISIESRTNSLKKDSKTGYIEETLNNSIAKTLPNIILDKENEQFSTLEKTPYRSLIEDGQSIYGVKKVEKDMAVAFSEEKLQKTPKNLEKLSLEKNTLLKKVPKRVQKEELESKVRLKKVEKSLLEEEKDTPLVNTRTLDNELHRITNERNSQAGTKRDTNKPTRVSDSEEKLTPIKGKETDKTIFNEGQTTLGLVTDKKNKIKVEDEKYLRGVGERKIKEEKEKYLFPSFSKTILDLGIEKTKEIQKAKKRIKETKKSKPISKAEKDLSITKGKEEKKIKKIERSMAIEDSEKQAKIQKRLWFIKQYGCIDYKILPNRDQKYPLDISTLEMELEGVYYYTLRLPLGTNNKFNIRLYNSSQGRIKEVLFDENGYKDYYLEVKTRETETEIFLDIKTRMVEVAYMRIESNDRVLFLATEKFLSENHPIPFGEDMGLKEIPIHIPIMVEFINILLLFWSKFYLAFTGYMGAQAIYGLVNMVYEWLTLEESQEDAGDSLREYERCFRWLRWEAEKVYQMAKQDPDLNGNAWVEQVIFEMIDYMEMHHFDKIPEFITILKMDEFRNIYQDPSFDMDFILDKVKGVRKRVVKKRKIVDK